MKNFVLEKTIKKYFLQNWFHDGIIYRLEFKDLDEMIMVVDAPWEWDLKYRTIKKHEIPQHPYYKYLYQINFKEIKYLRLKYLCKESLMIKRGLDEFLHSKIKTASKINEALQQKFKKKFIYVSIKCVRRSFDIVFAQANVKKLKKLKNVL